MQLKNHCCPLFPTTLLGVFNMTTASSKPESFDLDDFVASAMAEYDTAPKAAPKKTKAPEMVAAPVVEPPKPILLKDGESLFSTLFGRVPKNMTDFAVRKFTDVPSNFTHLIPKMDTKYVVQTEEAARLVAAIMDGDKVLLSGPTGSGKSSLVKYACAVVAAPFLRINMSADAESSVLFGQLVARDGSTVWQDGPITEAVRYGGVVLIDEWELMPPEISMGLQNLLEDDGYLFLKEMPGDAVDKTIIPHKNFRIVCAGNTVGQGDDTGGFSGTMVQNSATLDRFTTTIRLDYLSPEHEVAIMTGKTGIAYGTARDMVRVAGLVRNAYNQRSVNLTMSPRTLINWASKTVKYGDSTFAFRVAFFDKLRDSDKKAVSELFSKVMGASL
jgi:cobaltochelatase CobS